MSDIQVGVLGDEVSWNWGSGHPTGVAKETKKTSKLEIEFNCKLKKAGGRKHGKAAPEDAAVGEKREREGVVEEKEGEDIDMEKGDSEKERVLVTSITTEQEKAEKEAGKVAKKAKILPERPDTAVNQEFPTQITNTVGQIVAKGRATAATLADTLTALQKSVRGMRETQRGITARLDNRRITNANLRALTIDKGTMMYRAKKKEIAGDGTALANDLAPNNIAQLATLPQPPIVGTMYSPTINAHGLTHQTILNLIQFYNEDFDILVDDPIAAR